MRSFTDNKNRRWEIELNVYQMKRVRSLLGVDLVNVITLGEDGKVKVDLIDRIANDPCLLVDILYVLVESEAKKENISDVDFGSSLAGEAIEMATKAFLDELVDFFPGARRLFLKKAVEISQKYGDEMKVTLEKVLEDPEFEKKVKESMSSSVSLPASSE